MLEYFDEKLGKIKLVNVTEARANFAKLLADDSHYYVITKNNKPQRVVISYDEFRDLRLLAEHGKTAERPIAPTPTAKAGADKNLAHKPYVKAPSRVKGLLAQHFQDPIEVPEVKEQPVNTVAKPVWPEVTQSEVSDDYFQTSDASDLPQDPIEEIELLNPEEIMDEQDAHELEAQVLDDQAVLDDIRNSLSIAEEFTSVDFSHPTSTDQSVQNEQEFVEEEQLDSAADTNTINDEPIDSFRVESNSIESPQATQVVQRTPEEEEYYNKYRKLYESVPEREPEPSFEPQIIFENRKRREVKTIVDSLPELNVEADEVARHFMDQPKPESPKQADPVSSAAQKTQKQSVKVDLGVAQSLIDEKSDLPSLQELLRGLDSDDADEGDLSEGEIDDIVRQIRHEE